MTAPLIHPVLPLHKAIPDVDMKAIEAAIASLSYWTRPAQPAAPEPGPEITPLEQMFAYYG